MPSADFCRPVRSDYSSPSPAFRTDGRSLEVSSTTFSAQPPNLRPMPLMDLNFVVISRLVRHRMPRIRFLSIGSRHCSTLPSHSASRRRPCVVLGLDLHQVVQGTFTLKLPNMLGTQKKGEAETRFPCVSVRARPRAREPRASRAKPSRSWSGRHRTIRSGHLAGFAGLGLGLLRLRVAPGIPAPSTCRECPAVRRHSSRRTSR